MLSMDLLAKLTSSGFPCADEPLLEASIQMAGELAASRESCLGLGGAGTMGAG
jgi:hypothetical protein